MSFDSQPYEREAAPIGSDYLTRFMSGEAGSASGELTGEWQGFKVPRAITQITSFQLEGIEGLESERRDVCELLSQGLSNPAIAEQAQIKEPRVKDHLKDIYRLLDVDERYSAIRLLASRTDAMFSPDRLIGLGNEEREVISQMLLGKYDQKSLGQGLGIVPSTAKARVINTCNGLGAPNRSVLITWLPAIEQTLRNHVEVSLCRALIHKQSIEEPTTQSDDTEVTPHFAKQLRWVIHQLCGVLENAGILRLATDATYRLPDEVLDELSQNDLLEPDANKSKSVGMGGLVLAKLLEHEIYGPLLKDNEMRAPLLKEVKYVTR